MIMSWLYYLKSLIYLIFYLVIHGIIHVLKNTSIYEPSIVGVWGEQTTYTANKYGFT